MQANYAGESAGLGVVKGPLPAELIQEAVAGYRIADGIWVDGGIYLSHLGFESFISRDDWTYTRSLMSATPALFEEDRRIKIRFQGEMPSPLNPPSGCTFHQRCPYAIEKCRHEEPALRFVDGRHVSCHRAEEVGEIDA